MAEFGEHESRDDLDVLRHSTAHLLAAAVTELRPGAKYAIGPPVQDGFYYDFDLEEPFGEADLKQIEERMRDIARRDPAYEHVHLPRDEALETFRRLGQDYKVELIEDRVREAEVSCYRTGEFLDLCRGPHVPSARSVRHFKLMRLAGAYWRGDEKRKQLQRIYGTAWPTKDELAKYLEFLKDAEARDHKRVGRELKLFALDERTGAGNVLWLPAGATIRREIERWVVDEELSRGYQHVVTPVMAKLDLYRRSGHYELYKDSMFPPMRFEDGEELELRPMNCPHHILVYQSEMRSYRDLPLRIAEIGNNYRYEKSGELMGMIRVRSFALNDAHIFCTPEQLLDEVVGAIRLALHFMEVLGVDDFWYRLSMRDQVKDKWVGRDEQWEHAQAVLAEALESVGQTYQRGEGEAAFYGPKIDFQVRDAMRREFTNSTVQVDFQLPERFELEYVAEDGSRQRPVMVHRGAFGAMERMIAYLIEKYGGAFPTWLAPTQVVVIPITDEHAAYAGEVAERLRRSRLRVEVDARGERMQRKIRDAERRKVPYMAVVGASEAEARSVAVRRRGGEQASEDLEAFSDRLAADVAARR